MEVSRTRPRMLPRRTRYLIGGVLFVASWVMFYLTAFLPTRGAELGALATTALAVSGLFVVMNLGFRPRIRDGFLVVSTFCGRQAVDLSALTRVGLYWPNLNHRRATVRLADPVNVLTTGLPQLDEFRDVLAGAFGEAGERGVVVPRSARLDLGLPADEHAPRWGYRAYLREAVLLAGVWPLGVLAVIVAWNVF
jgi:hypothetical protein